MWNCSQPYSLLYKLKFKSPTIIIVEANLSKKAKRLNYALDQIGSKFSRQGQQPIKFRVWNYYYLNFTSTRRTEIIYKENILTRSIICRGQVALLCLFFVSAKPSRVSKKFSQHLVRSSFCWVWSSVNSWAEKICIKESLLETNQSLVWLCLFKRFKDKLISLPNRCSYGF